MALRTCLVSFRDPRGSTHTAEVSATSLYEAVVLGYHELKRTGLIEDIPGPATPLDVEVREPVVRHRVTRLQVQRWLDERTTNPSMQARKHQLRELLVAK
jgi:hypothetical protein